MYVPIPIVVGGGYGHDTVVVNNAANPPPTNSEAWNDEQQAQQEDKPWLLKFLFHATIVVSIVFVLYVALRRFM